jgi:hypothetical protein
MKNEIMSPQEITQVKNQSDPILKMKIGAIMATMTSLLLFLPAPLTHAAGVTFTTDPQGNWEFSSGYTDHNVFSMYITADGRGRSTEQMDPVDTDVASTVPMEALEADTPGGSYSNTCSTPQYTDDTASDFACNDAATLTQGFTFTQDHSPVPQAASEIENSESTSTTTNATSSDSASTNSSDTSSISDSSGLSHVSGHTKLLLDKGVSGSSLPALNASTSLPYLILKLPIPVLLNLLTQYQQLL